jgi:hypothetical protein
MQTAYARHGKPKMGMTLQEIARYRQRNTPPTLQPHIEPESPFDIRGHVKPQSRAWMSGKTIWFTLYRIARPGHVSEGQWIPITRTLIATPERRKMIRRVLKAREQLADEMLDIARAQQAQFVSPIPDHDRINAHADADLAIIETFQKMADAALAGETEAQP